jgi:ABC-type uncharacterized transport system permease subunit
MHDIFVLIAALGYLGAVILLYFSVLRESRSLTGASITLVCIGALAHAAAQYHHWVPLGGQEVSLLNVLSLCALVVVLLLVASLTMTEPLYHAGLVILPIAIVALLLEWGISAPGNLIASEQPGLSIHIVCAVMAFGVLSIAAVYAIFVALIDHFLRQRRLNRIMRTMPGLVVLERHLFQLITVGFIFLTAALAVGLTFINDLFAQHLAHKTILAILAWLVFGVLLWGRYFRGWRGRLAVRLTLAGMLILLLSYFGSKLVLEVILHSGWRA